jgi:hypothetical protein
LDQCEPIEGILLRFEALEIDGVLEVGSIPVGVHTRWSGLRSDRCIITGERKAHILQRHPEMMSLTVELVQTLLDPDEIHANKEDPTMAIFWRSIQTGGIYYLRVAVSLSMTEGLHNSVISAWQVRRQDYERAIRQGRRLWKRA